MEMREREQVHCKKNELSKLTYETGNILNRGKVYLFF